MRAVRIGIVVGLSCGSGCAEEVVPPPEPPAPSGDCTAGPAEVAFAQEGTGYGGLVDGDPILYGWPPQGGAPYAGFDVRYAGLSGPDVVVELVATDTADGSEVGYASYAQRFICSNTGDNEGWYVTSELHMRFFGYDLEELAGREVDVEITVDDGAGGVVAAGVRGVLTLQ